MAFDNAKQAIRKDIGTTFGQVNVENGTENIKTPVMSFNQGNVYLGLKLVSYYDVEKGVHKDAVPKITASFNGKFVDVPLSGKWWKAYSEFVSKFADAMDGVEITQSNIKDDVVTAKTMMAKYKAKE